MDFQRLRYFLEVARQKNFSRAARICRVSQPSLSQQIKKLEDEAGGPLFLRARGAVRLTEFGESFLKHAQAIIGEVRVAEEFVSRTRGESRRTVRFGAIPTIAPYLVPEIFRGIRAAHPEARFELIENRTEVVVGALLTGGIDFALLSPPTGIDGECEFLKVLKDDFLLTLPVGHPLAGTRSIRMDRLRGERFILLENAHCLSRQTAAYCEQAGLTADVSIRSSQIDTLLGMVEAGFGLTFTPRLAANSHAHREVVYRALKPANCSREVRLMWLPRQFLSPSKAAVIDFFKLGAVQSAGA